MSANEIVEQNDELLTPEVSETVEAKIEKNTLCRACGVCDKTETYTDKGKKFDKCIGCGFLVRVV